jgi:prophage regulatory protein
MSNETRRIYRLKELPRVTGLSLTTIWRLQKSGDFPPRVQLSPGRVGCLASAVDTWVESRQQVA